MTTEDSQLRCKYCGQLSDKAICDESRASLREWLTYGSAKNFKVAPDVLMELAEDDDDLLVN